MGSQSRLGDNAPIVSCRPASGACLSGRPTCLMPLGLVHGGLRALPCLPLASYVSFSIASVGLVTRKTRSQSRFRPGRIGLGRMRLGSKWSGLIKVCKGVNQILMIDVASMGRSPEMMVAAV